MSVKQMSLAWDLDLPANQKYVLLAYADHAHDDGSHVFPSLARIAHKTGYSRDQIRRVSKELRESGLMELVREATPTHPAEYQLTLERGSNLPPLHPPRGRGANATPRVANDPPGVGVQMPPEPSVRTIKEPSVAPQGPDGPSKEEEIEQTTPDLPAKALTTLTVDRVKEVGFEPATHQKQNWGRGWADYVYVPEGETPPSPEQQFAVLGEIISAAAGKGGKARYFLAVEDAVKRVEGKDSRKVSVVTPLDREERRKREAAERRRQMEDVFGKEVV